MCPTPGDLIILGIPLCLGPLLSFGTLLFLRTSTSPEKCYPLDFKSYIYCPCGHLPPLPVESIIGPEDKHEELSDAEGVEASTITPLTDV